MFAVTTRSRLRAPWLFPQMAFATWRVRRQLAKDPSVVVWASLVASPTEFWTITVWRSRHDMQEFMRSGAHDDIMWLFGRLLSSFWLMRWRPTGDEIGEWRGIRLGGTAEQSESSGEARPELQRALEHLPWLADATGPDGQAAYRYSSSARRKAAEVADSAGLVVNLHPRRRHAWASLATLRGLRESAASSGAVRSSIGFARPGDAYLLAVWNDREALERFVHSRDFLDAAARWEGHFWSVTWLPENEFGHWDELRLRRRRRPAIPVPSSSAHLG